MFLAFWRMQLVRILAPGPDHLLTAFSRMPKTFVFMFLLRFLCFFNIFFIFFMFFYIFLKVFKLFKLKAWKTCGKSIFSLKILVFLKVFKLFQPKAWKTYGKSIFSLKVLVFLKVFKTIIIIITIIITMPGTRTLIKNNSFCLNQLSASSSRPSLVGPYGPLWAHMDPKNPKKICEKIAFIGALKGPCILP